MAKPTAASSRTAAQPSAAHGSAIGGPQWALEQKVNMLVEKVAALEEEVLFLRRCSRTLFKNDGLFASYLYYAHDVIYTQGVPPSPVGHLHAQSGPSALYPDAPDGQFVWEIRRVVT
jgi:hypothetical protein